MSKSLTIKSHLGPYSVSFGKNFLADLNSLIPDNSHFIIDKKVASIYKNVINKVLSSSSVLQIDATEANKSIDKVESYVEQLVKNGIRRGHTLIAIGGGIMQDITAFLATVLFRGVNWKFYPTTLLAQADSCIGSKSSINVGMFKNILGTFTPPREIFVGIQVLESLSAVDVRSGIGEMIKVHIIDGPNSFSKIAKDFNYLTTNEEVLCNYIYKSLEIKQQLIEVDEFDKGIRNVMNYGHSFGHAIESATDFSIPHGVAVTIGMDMANYFALQTKRIKQDEFEHMHKILAKNYVGFESFDIPFDKFIDSISKDKKNTTTHLKLILLNSDLKVEIVKQENNVEFHNICKEYLEKARTV